MKIKIDKSGSLWLERAGKMKEALCPEDHYLRKDSYGSTGYPTHWSCGDWCALFYDYLINTKHVDEHAIELCKKEYVVRESDFIDERGKE